MNKKIFAAVFSMILLCSCGNSGTAEVSETETESVTVTSVSSETTVTTTAAETASEAVSEVSERSEKAPITRDFFNDDVVFEEVMLPVKRTYYSNGEDRSTTEYNFEYDYYPNGAYKSVFEYRNGNLYSALYYNEKGYCTSETGYNGYEHNYKYEFDSEGRLIRKETSYGSFSKYSYDENGIFYEEYCDMGVCRHEYDSSIEKVYRRDTDGGEEVLWEILEKDKNGNTIKMTIDEGVVSKSEFVSGKRFAEYKYDNMNRLIYENHTVSEDFSIPNDATYVYLRTYEYEGDKLKKQTYSYYFGTESQEYFFDDGRLVKKVYIYDGEPDDMNGFLPAENTTEYFYNDDGSIISQTHDMNGVLIEEAEYKMIEQPKTDIEYKYFYEVEP